MPTQSKSLVIKAHEGEAFWQPGVKGNCITIKVSPENASDTKHLVFMSEMPKNAEVGEHAHENDTEIFICLEGEGVITINDQDHFLKQHDIAYVPPFTKHRIRATSDTTFKFMVVVTPPGLEARLKLMGRQKKSHDETPPEAFDSEAGKQSSHGVL